MPTSDPSETRRSVDVVLIGTSPLIMLRALHAHHQGKSVLTVDRADRMGGAWYTRDLWDFKHLEMGSHVIRNRGPAYRFIQDVLGVDLSPPDGLEFGFIGKQRVPLPIYRLRNVVRSVATDLRRGRVREASAELPTLWRVATSARTPFQYPIAGCVGIVRRLSEMLADAGIPVELGGEIHSVDVAADRSGGICETHRGPIAFRQIVFGQSGHCPVTVNGEPFPIRTGKRATSNILLHLRGRRLRKFTYFELRRDPLLRRVRNIGVFLDPPIAEPDIVVVAHVQRNQSGSDEAEFAERVLERLVEFEVLHPDTVVVSANIDRFEGNKIGVDEVDRVAAALGPVVLPVRTWDLGEELTTLLKQPGALEIPPYARQRSGVN